MINRRVGGSGVIQVFGERTIVSHRFRNGEWHCRRAARQIWYIVGFTSYCWRGIYSRSLIWNDTNAVSSCWNTFKWKYGKINQNGDHSFSEHLNARIRRTDT